MQGIWTLLSLLSFTLGALAAPLHNGSYTPQPPSSVGPNNPTISSSQAPQNTTTPSCDSAEHVIILSASCPHPEEVMARLGLHCNHTNVTYTYNNPAFKGFAANLHSSSVQALDLMSDVAHIQRASAVRHHSHPHHPHLRHTPLHTRDITARPDAPWNLQRISSPTALPSGPLTASYTYAYTPPTLGLGSDIYIVDSGIYDANAEFSNRVIQGFSYTPDNADLYGHGTHVAGTAAGSHFGVASNANLIAIKVLGAEGAGTSSATIAGMDQVVRFHATRKAQKGFVGSVMSMSWGLSSSDSAVNAAVTAAADAGIHIAVAAGNDGKDACSFSPSLLGGPNSPHENIITVGSFGRSDSISSFSNTGSCVDIYAPGEDVLSAWPNGTDATNLMTGTSMSTPHVSGMMAVLLAAEPGLGEGGKLKERVVGMAQMGLSGEVGGGGYAMLNNDVVR